MSDQIQGDKIEKVRQVELLISNLLRIGVTVSLLVVIAGTVFSFTHHPDYLSKSSELGKMTGPGAQFPHSIKSVVKEVFELRGRAIVMAGLVLLIATPVARVAVSIFAFVYQDDYVFVMITSSVLVLLILSFFLGRAG